MKFKFDIMESAALRGAASETLKETKRLIEGLIKVQKEKEKNARNKKRWNQRTIKRRQDS